MPLRGNVFNIERCSVHDGDGVRTIVYLKGCTLNCKWCHNPEGISAKPEVLYQISRCIRCGTCINTCKHGCYTLNSDQLKYTSKECVGCFSCVDACPANALTAYGKQLSAAEVFDDVLKDIGYYKRTGGGVTVSGGECLCQPEFVKELLELCKKNNISTLIETAMYIPYQNVLPVIPLTDTFYIDIKHMDSNTHKLYTGHGNGLILENIEKLSLVHKDIVIRIPVIPDVNADKENLMKTGEFAKSLGINKIELLKYNNLAKTKYVLLGKDFHDFSEEELDLCNICNHLNAALKTDNLFYTSV